MPSGQNVADLILKKQVANIIKKANAGKVLSVREQEILEDYQESKESIATNKNVPKSLNSFRGAAEYLGLDISVLEAAKKGGCPAFRHSRVYVSELIKWLESNKKIIEEASDKESFELERVKLRLAREKFEFELKMGNYILKDSVKESAMSLVSELRSTLRRVLLSDLPPLLEGLNAIEIREKNAEALRQIEEITYGSKRA